MPPIPRRPLGLYVHVPYCTVRCSYCDFYLVSGRQQRLEPYVAALCGEIGAVGAPLRGRHADTVHFGGGTPSLLSSPSLRAILDVLGRAFLLAPGSEIALEANPEDIDPARMRGLTEIGVTRLTIGIQSLDDRLLARMRRPHDSRQAMLALEGARAAGFASLGVDLILGFPGQAPGRALEEIDRVIDRGVDHLSLYLLEVHSRTRLGRDVALGRATPMEEDAAAGLYDAASEFLVRSGFEHYEISNFARPGHRSRHNLKYWTDVEYLGFGPSAHSYLDGRRWSNAADLAAYLKAGGVGIERVDDPQPRSGRGGEALVAGLRVSDGVDLRDLRERYGAALPGPDDPAIAALGDAGFVEIAGSRLRLTRRGRLVSNEVFERLLPPLS